MHGFKLCPFPSLRAIFGLLKARVNNDPASEDQPRSAGRCVLFLSAFTRSVCGIRIQSTMGANWKYNYGQEDVVLSP